MLDIDLWYPEVLQKRSKHGADVTLALVSSHALPAVLGALPAALAVGVLCAAVVIEIAAVPAVLLPGGAMTLLAGALICAGRPALAVAKPVVAAVIVGDQLAYFSGAAVLAASSLTCTGHVAGIVGIIASVVVAGLLAARHGPGMMRGRGRRSRPEEWPLSSTVS
jgi:hypothetical protein